MYTVSITSQGQVTIPAKLRRELGLDKRTKAIVRKEGNSLVVEPVKDLMELKGALKHKAIKGKSIDEIIKMEEEAIGDAVVERYKRKLKRESNKLQIVKP